MKAKCQLDPDINKCPNFEPYNLSIASHLSLFKKYTNSLFNINQNNITETYLKNLS